DRHESPGVKFGRRFTPVGLILDWRTHIGSLPRYRRKVRSSNPPCSTILFAALPRRRWTRRQWRLRWARAARSDVDPPSAELCFAPRDDDSAKTRHALVVAQLDKDLIPPRAQRDAGLRRGQAHDDAIVVLEPDLADRRGRNGEPPRALDVGAGELGEVVELVDVARRLKRRQGTRADELA